MIARRHRQLLVHSYIYYVLGESIIDDTTFDAWRREMIDMHAKRPDEAKAAPYYDLAKGFVDSPSGFFIKSYPPEIVSVATRLLWSHMGEAESFEAFLARYGLKIAR